MPYANFSETIHSETRWACGAISCRKNGIGSHARNFFWKRVCDKVYPRRVVFWGSAGWRHASVRPRLWEDRKCVKISDHGWSPYGA